jgi:hypothetical protein
MSLNEQLLDDADALAGADPSGSLRALAGAGAQVRIALTATAEAGLHPVTVDGRPRAVVVASLGGSAVVGDVLTLLAGGGSPVPVTVRRGPPLPGWVGPLDMLVAVSMSGRAPGPLGLAAEAARRGCRLLTVGSPDSPLAEVATRTGGVHVPVQPAATPAARVPDGAVVAADPGGRRGQRARADRCLADRAVAGRRPAGRPGGHLPPLLGRLREPGEVTGAGAGLQPAGGPRRRRRDRGGGVPGDLDAGPDGAGPGDARRAAG